MESLDVWLTRKIIQNRDIVQNWSLFFVIPTFVVVVTIILYRSIVEDRISFAPLVALVFVLSCAYLWVELVAYLHVRAVGNAGERVATPLSIMLRGVVRLLGVTVDTPGYAVPQDADLPAQPAEKRPKKKK